MKCFLSLVLARSPVQLFVTIFNSCSDTEQVLKFWFDIWNEVFSFLYEAFTLCLLSLIQLYKSLLLRNWHLSSWFQLSGISWRNSCIVRVSKHTLDGFSVWLFILKGDFSFLSSGWLLIDGLINFGGRLLSGRIVVDNRVGRGESWWFLLLSHLIQWELLSESFDSSIVLRVNSGVSSILENITNLISMILFINFRLIIGFTIRWQSISGFVFWLWIFC